MPASGEFVQLFNYSYLVQLVQWSLHSMAWNLWRLFSQRMIYWGSVYFPRCCCFRSRQRQTISSSTDYSWSCISSHSSWSERWVGCSALIVWIFTKRSRFSLALFAHWYSSLLFFCYVSRESETVSSGGTARKRTADPLESSNPPKSFCSFNLVRS